MIPEFLQPQESLYPLDIWKTIIALLLVLYLAFAGVEIRVGNEQDEKE